MQGSNGASRPRAVAVIAVRTTVLRVLSYGVQLEPLRMLADRLDKLSKTRALLDT